MNGARCTNKLTRFGRPHSRRAFSTLGTLAAVTVRHCQPLVQGILQAGRIVSGVLETAEVIYPVGLTPFADYDSDFAQCFLNDLVSHLHTELPHLPEAG